MASPNSTITITPGSGDTVRSHTVSGAKVQTMVLVDQSGHMIESKPTYIVQTPFAALAANRSFLELWMPSGSTRTARIHEIGLVKNFAAVTGVPFEVQLRRTSAIGTTGRSALTPIRLNTSSAAAATTDIDCGYGATAGNTSVETMLTRFFNSEETNAAAQLQEVVGFWPPSSLSRIGQFVEPLTLRPGVGEGLQLIQITATTVGTYSAYAVFTLE